jgi:hypothetical protein
MERGFGSGESVGVDESLGSAGDFCVFALVQAEEDFCLHSDCKNVYRGG